MLRKNDGQRQCDRQVIHESRELTRSHNQWTKMENMKLHFLCSQKVQVAQISRLNIVSRQMLEKMMSVRAKTSIQTMCFL